MKKLFVFASAALLLAGCGSSNEVKKETKTCSIEESGLSMAVKMDAEDDIIKNFEFSMVLPSTMTGMDASTLSEEALNAAGEAGLSNMGLEEGTEGVTTKVSAKEKDLQVTVNIDLNKIDEEVLKKMDLPVESKNAKLSEVVKDAEASEFTCK